MINVLLYVTRDLENRKLHTKRALDKVVVSKRLVKCSQRWADRSGRDSGREGMK